jgi:hypothetical protein
MRQNFPNLLRIPVELDLGSAPKPPETFSGTFFCTFSGTLLNLTSLCTKSPHHFSGTFLGTLSNLT